MSAAWLPEGSPRAGRLHWPLIACVAAVALCGVYNLHSSAGHRAPWLWLWQLAWLSVGALVAVPFVAIDYKRSHPWAYGALLACTVGLVLVLLAGKNVMGARRWLAVGPLTLQPSELCKLALIAGLARYFAARLPQQGYSIRRLVRPLLWTRPVAAAALLLGAWRRPWLLDPIGELARGVHARLEQPPELLPQYWFRVVVALGIVLSAAGTLWLVRTLRARAELLHPWAPYSQRRLSVLCVAAHAGLGALLAWHWQTPWLCDPVGSAMLALHTAGGIDGALGVPQTKHWPRAVLAALLVLWGVAAGAAGRHARAHRLLTGEWLAPIDLIAAPSVLVLVQPDLGSALMLLFCGGTMVFVVGLLPRSLLYLSALGAGTSVLAWFAVLKEYQKRRIWTFIDPEQDVRGAGWNAVQSLIAVGSGRAFGKGHKNGTQTQLSFLPEQHTDFAFSVWAEEQGFVGCALLLGLYALIVLFGLQIAMRARDPYGALLATGVTALVLWQAVINAGMVIGVLPVVGIPLPLFSYGGSSVLTVLMGVGVLLNVHLRRRRL